MMINGRKEPKFIYPHIKWAAFKDSLTQLPPTTLDWTVGDQGLAKPLGNLYLGDCLAASAGHITDTWNYNAKTGVMVTGPQTVRFYSSFSGYIPGNPATDEGGTCQEALACWEKHGFLGGGRDTIDGYVGVNAADQQEVEQCIWLFGGCFAALFLPDEWVNPIPRASGFVWDVAGPPNPRQGHAVPMLGYPTSQGVVISTWGFTGTITWPAVAKYFVSDAGGETYAAVAQNWFNKSTGLSPSGFDSSQLDAALALLKSSS